MDEKEFHGCLQKLEKRNRYQNGVNGEIMKQLFAVLSCVVSLICFVYGPSCNGQATPTVTLSPIQLLPRVVQAGKVYTIRLRYASEYGLKPYATYCFVPGFFASEYQERWLTSPGARVTPKIFGTDYKHGVTIVFQVRPSLPPGTSGEFEGHYYIEVRGTRYEDVNGNTLPGRFSLYPITVRGKLVSLPALIPSSLTGHWHGNNNDLEFLGNGKVIVHRIDTEDAGSRIGDCSFIGSNRFLVTVGPYAYPFRNVFIRSKELHLFSEKRNQADILRKQ